MNNTDKAPTAVRLSFFWLAAVVGTSIGTFIHEMIEAGELFGFYDVLLGWGYITICAAAVIRLAYYIETGDKKTEGHYTLILGIATILYIVWAMVWYFFLRAA